jgi:hypothetical protein
MITANLNQIYIHIADEIVDPEVFFWYYLFCKEARMKGKNMILEAQPLGSFVVNPYLCA